MDVTAIPTVPLQSDGAGIVILLVYLAIIVVSIAGMWKTFEKAGQPGWASIIPILNIYYMLKIADRDAWWLILFFIPVISLIPAIIVPIDMAKNFGKGTGFGLGLAFLPFIFYPLLGFGDANYNGHGPAGGAGAGASGTQF
ncbi:signal peptidase I [Halorubellus sp. JP-L1]|nr:signal peptidase I [Halorubellus sp. JP-L1]